MLVLTLGVLFTFAGATLLYLASPHQAAAAQAWPGRHAWLLGGAALAGGLAGLLAVFAPLAAIFGWIILAMLWWTCAPPVIAWFRARRTDAA